MHWFIDKLMRLLYPPKCPACGVLLTAEHQIMCPDCADDYRTATERACPQCLKPMHECVCPNRFLDRHGVHKVIKLFTYYPGEPDSAVNRMVFRLKRCDSEATIAFLADRLSDELKKLLEDDAAYAVTGVPRSAAAIRRYGGDHVHLLCRAIAARLHIPYVRAIRRIGRESPQKKKNYKERMSSARVSYAPKESIDLHGYRVILVDDVVTSGATLAVCASSIRKCGARQVTAAVIGSSYRYRDLIGSKQYYLEKQKYVH